MQFSSDVRQSSCKKNRIAEQKQSLLLDDKDSLDYNSDNKKVDLGKGGRGAKLFKILLLFILVTAVCLFLSLTVQSVTPESDDPPNAAKTVDNPTQNATKEFHILKPKLDTRKYKYIELRNGLKVMLVHHTYDVASCGIVIGAGAMATPFGFEGLAHYTEHSIFSGSKNYPQPGYLVKFVERNDGYRNAYTTDMTTNYYIVIKPDMLDKGMHVFSDMFKTPLWHKDHIEREKISVQNELEKDRVILSSKAYNVAKLIGDPKHPWARFDFGAKSIFDEKNYMPEIKKFFKKYYTSKLMAMVVAGPQSFDKLEELANKHWLDLPDHEMEQPTFYSNPYPTKYISQEAWFSVPGMDSEIYLHFPIAWTKDKMEKYDIRLTSSLITHLLAETGPGSLTWKMKSLKYGHSASGALNYISNSFCMFSVSLSVSNNGLCNRNRVIKLFFDYINILKKSITKDMWDNYYAENKFRFEYREDIMTSDLAISVTSLLFRDPKWMLNSPQYAEKYNPELIQMILGKLRGDNMNIVGQINEGSVTDTSTTCGVNTNFDKYDKYFLTKFSVQKIPQNWIKLWNAPSSLAVKKYFKIVPEEAFIPRNLTLLPSNGMHSPEILLYDYGIRAFWKQDTTFPKLHLTTAIYLGLTGEQTVLAADLKVFCALALHHVYKQTKAARRVGFTVKIRPEHRAMVVDINGYSDQELFYKFTKLVFDALLKVDRQSKREYKEVHDSVLNDLLIDDDESQKIASKNQGVNFFRDDWIQQQVLHDEVYEMRQEDILNFAEDVFHKVSLRSTVYGNIDKEQAMNLLKLVQGYFQGDVITDHWVSFPNVLGLPKGRYVLQTRTHNMMEANNMIRFVWQIGPNEVTKHSLTNQIMTSILQMLIHSEAYDELRSRQQIGYTVHSQYYTEAGCDYFTFYIQGSRFSADEITKRSLDFLENYFRRVLVKFVTFGSDELRNPSAWFDEILAGAVGNLWGVDNYSKRMHSRWPYYSQYSYIKLVESTVPKGELLRFYDKYILNGRTLILQYHAAKSPFKRPSFKHTGIISDIPMFRSGLKVIPMRYSW